MIDTLKTLGRRTAKKAVKTFFQTLGGTLAASGTGIIDADLTGALSVSGMAAAIAICMNLGSEDGDQATE